MLKKLDARSSARKSYNLMLEARLDSSICGLVKACDIGKEFLSQNSNWESKFLQFVENPVAPNVHLENINMFESEKPPLFEFPDIFDM